MIQMLAQWNGLEALTVYSLSSPEETRLIGLGLARGFTPGMDGSSGSYGSVAATITGNPGAGNVLTATIDMAFGGAPTYVWRRDGAAIGGATVSTYAQVSADRGHTITCQVSGLVYVTNSISVPAGADPGVAPTVTTVPAIIGTPTVGVAATYTPGVYAGTPAPTVSARQWLLGGATIVDATSATYTPISGDATHLLSVRETATNTAGSVSSTSAAKSVGAEAPAAPSFATYALGLAGVADGGHFSVPTADSSQSLNYVRDTSTQGRLLSITPNTNAAAINAAHAAVLALPMSVAPLVDWDSVSCYYGLREFDNLASGAPAATLNLLAGFGASTEELSLRGGATVILEAADPDGGTSGFRLQIPVGAVSDSGALPTVDIPAGQWTFAAKIRRTGGIAGSTSMLIGSWSSLNLVPITVTGDWQDFTTTFHFTTDTPGRSMALYQGEKATGAVTTVATDVEVAWLRVTPGTILAPAITTPMPIRKAKVNTGSLNSDMLLTSVANNVIQVNSPSATYANWSLLCSLEVFAAAAGTNLFWSPLRDGSLSNSYLSNIVTSSAGQLLSSLGYDSASAATDGRLRISGMGKFAFGVVSNGTTMRWFVNGFLACVTTFNRTLSDTVRLAFGGGGFGAPSFSGLYAGGAFWGSAQTDEQMAAHSAVAAARLVAKGLAVTPTTVMVATDGDSLTVESSPVTRMLSLVDEPSLVYQDIAFGGGQLGPNDGNSLVDRAPTLDAIITPWITAGLRVFVPILIGTNDANTVITQAAAEAYYANLCAYYAGRRALGAEVIACTLVPNGSTGTNTASYDHTPITIVGGAFDGQTFAGCRKYVSAMLRADSSKYDALCDYDLIPEFENWSDTYYGTDPLHPNDAGKVILSTALTATVNGLRAA